jgi:predicted protein tyrosine phosphatase
MASIDYMFICDCGVNRSPAGARVFRQMAEESGKRITTDFMGFGIPESRAGERIVGKVLQSTRKVFVMDDSRRKEVINTYGVPEEKVVNLDIPDEYNTRGLAGPQLSRMLEKVLRTKLRPYVDEIC